MMTPVLPGPYGHGTDIVQPGTSPEGRQRYCCRQCLEGRGHTLLLAYAYAGQSPALTEQSGDMAIHASGMRETARVRHVSPTTLMQALNKRHLHSHKCIRRW